MLPKVLIVEPNVSRGFQLARALDGVADVDAVTDFSSARALLLMQTPHLMVVNLRLGPYNGLHLVYAAAAAGVPVRSIVYTENAEPGLGTEVQAAGAFYETREHLRTALGSYLSADLPEHDRRDVWRAVLDSTLEPGRMAGAHVASWFAH